MSSAISWIEWSISGRGLVRPQRDALEIQGRLGDVAVGDRGVALLGQLDLELGELGDLACRACEALSRPRPEARRSPRRFGPDLDSHGSLLSSAECLQILRPRARRAKGTGEHRRLDLDRAQRAGAPGRSAQRRARGQHVVDQQDARGRRAGGAHAGRRGPPDSRRAPHLARPVGARAERASAAAPSRAASAPAISSAGSKPRRAGGPARAGRRRAQHSGRGGPEAPRRAPRRAPPRRPSRERELERRDQLAGDALIGRRPHDRDRRPATAAAPGACAREPRRRTRCADRLAPAHSARAHAAHRGGATRPATSAARRIWPSRRRSRGAGARVARASMRRGRCRDGSGLAGGDRAVAAGALGPVERRVGAADQGLGALLAVPLGDPGRARLALRGAGAQALDQLDGVVERRSREG